MRRFSLFTLALVLALGAAPALAQEFKAGDIVVEKPWARATPKGAEVGGGFFVVRNKGAAPDRLAGGTADFATVEIHETSSVGGSRKCVNSRTGSPSPRTVRSGSRPAAIT